MNAGGGPPPIRVARADETTGAETESRRAWQREPDTRDRVAGARRCRRTTALDDDWPETSPGLAQTCQTSTGFASMYSWLRDTSAVVAMALSPGKISAIQKLTPRPPAISVAPKVSNTANTPVI